MPKKKPIKAKDPAGMPDHLQDTGTNQNLQIDFTAKSPKLQIDFTYLGDYFDLKGQYYQLISEAMRIRAIIENKERGHG